MSSGDASQFLRTAEKAIDAIQSFHDDRGKNAETKKIRDKIYNLKFGGGKISYADMSEIFEVIKGFA